MKFTKPALTYAQQADLLLKRGLKADRAFLISRLEKVNYYRLAAYWYPFRKKNSDAFTANADFAIVWDNYVFDRQLRVVVLDAIERVEVAIKTQLANELALKHGPFAHLDRANLPNLAHHRHRKLMEKIQKEEDRSIEPFVSRFHRKYTSETNLPLWIAIEIMDFGTILTLFRGADQYTKRAIANRYGVKAGVLESWLVSLNYIRNICAHHARLWNRALSVRPAIPKKANNPMFHDPAPIPNHRVYGILTILQYLLGEIAPQSGWADRLEGLWTDKHPKIPIYRMGFPKDWKHCSIWSGTMAAGKTQTKRGKN